MSLYTVPFKQGLWRCPGCGAAWDFSASEPVAVRFSGGQWEERALNTGGTIICCGNIAERGPRDRSAAAGDFVSGGEP